MDHPAMWVTILVSCWAVGLLTSLHARSKGRGTLAWLVIGTLMPFLGLLVLETMEHIHSRRCPFCEGLVGKSAKVCQSCGRESS